MQTSEVFLPGWESVGVPLCVVDSNCTIIYANKAALSYGAKIFTQGNNLLQFITNSDVRDFIMQSFPALNSGELFEREVQLVQPTGEKRAGLFTFSKIECSFAHGVPSCLVLFYDTTSRSAMENVMESSFDNFIQTTINLDNAMKKIKAQKSVLDKFRIKMIKELEVARTVQRAIIARHFPKELTFECYGLNRPSDQIGGDYLDVIKIDAHNYGFIVADVSGHGVGPALITTMLRAWTFELFQKHRYLDSFFQELNTLVYETFSDTGFYLTAFAMILDKRSGELHISSAGHDAAMRIRETETTELGKESSGRVIGALPDSEFTYETVQLAPGDLLVLYTDGIPECRNKDGGFYGQDRMIRVIEANRTQAVKVVADSLLADLDEYAAGEKAHDDQTLLVLRWKTTL